MATDYDDKLTSAGSCVGCGREFEPEERYLSALFEDLDGFSRRDYCLSCWQGPPAESFSYWRGRIPAREEPAERVVNDAEALELFEQLEDVGEPRQVAFRYLLALLLVRKRVLKLISSGVRDGRPMVVARPGDGPEYQVLVPRLGQEELAEVSVQMGSVLDFDVDAQRREAQEGGEDV